MSVYRDKIVKAAKPHRCDECRKTIVVGERYNSWFQIYDGDAHHGHTCLTCDGLRSLAWEVLDWQDPEDAAPLGELRAYLREEEGIEDADAWYAEWRDKQDNIARVKRVFERAAAEFQGSAA